MTRKEVELLVDSESAMPCMRTVCDSNGLLTGFTRRSFAISIANLVSITALAAAQNSASLSGTVADTSGASISNARVKLTDATGHSLEAVTGSKGEFKFPNPPEGSYTLTAESPGFQNFKKEKLELRADAATRIDIAMQVGMLLMGATVEVVEIKPEKSKLPDKLQIHP